MKKGRNGARLTRIYDPSIDRHAGEHDYSGCIAHDACSSLDTWCLPRWRCSLHTTIATPFLRLKGPPHGSLPAYHSPRKPGQE